jgi:hypothetical protein
MIAPAVALMALTFLPTLFFYFLSPTSAVTSLATGTMVACAVGLGLTLFGLGRQMTSAWIVNSLSVVGGLLLLLTAHFVIALLLDGGFEPSRMAYSCVSLIAMLLGGMAIAAVLEKSGDSVDQAIAITRWSLIGCAILSVADINLWPGGWEKPIFPFTEPSHFALILNPFLAHACFANRGLRRAVWIIIGLSIAYTTESLTLAICVAGTGLMCMSLRGIVLSIVGGLASLKFLNLAYFIDRLNFSPDTKNISSLVYIQGWELLRDSLERTSYWGVGFQQLGRGSFNSPAADKLFAMTRTDFNITDGGFLLSKTISELGIVGLLFMVIYGRFFFLSLIAVRKPPNELQGEIPHSVFFAMCVICSFAMEILVRGLGYFSGESLLFVTSLFITAHYRAQNGGRFFTRAETLVS